MLSNKPYSDDELLAMLKNGCEKSFAKIYDKYWKLMFSIAAAKLKSPEDAREIVQDVFVSIWKRRSELVIDHSLKSYLAAAVKFKVYSFLAKQHRSAIKAESVILTSDFVLPDIESKFSFQEMVSKINLATKQLPERCQLIFILSREENLSHQEIADRLGISKKTVDNQIVKALKQVKAILRPLIFFFV